MKYSALVFSLLIFSFVTAGADDSPMVQTQQFLKNSKARDEEVSKTPEAQKADSYVTEVVGEGEKENVYEAASEIFGNFDGKSAEEMQAALAQASGDPQKFYESLKPEQRKKISEIADRVSKSKKKP